MITPSNIARSQDGSQLTVRYADGRAWVLAAEYLRVFSPSAEVRGHGLIEPMLVPGKQAVTVLAVEAAGRYAVRLRFSDGHDTGLYTWEILWELGDKHGAYWPRYLERMAEHGMRRDSELMKLSALGRA